MTSGQSLTLPDCVHVDANMHPAIYRHLFEFALVFDQTSLYAFSAWLYEEHNRIPLSQFRELLVPPGKSPFLLTAPSDWYVKEERVRRLNNAVVGWHDDFDGWVVSGHGYPLEAVITPHRSPKIRDIAWDTTKRFHEELLSKLGTAIDEVKKENVENELRTLWGAHSKAVSQFRADRELYERMQRTFDDKDKAERQYAGQLPVTFCQKIQHTDEYGKLLKENDPLALIVFEHVTKHHIIDDINHQVVRRGLSPFDMYVPARWHALLMGAIELSSTDELIRLKLRLSPEVQLAASATREVVEQVEGAPERDGSDIVATIKRFRAHGGPRVVRKAIEKSFRESFDATSLFHPDERRIKQAMEDAIRDVAGFAERLEVKKSWLQTALLACVFGGARLAGWVGTATGTPPLEAAEAGLYVLGGRELATHDKPGSITKRLAAKLAATSEEELLAMYSRWLRAGQPSDLVS